MSSINVNRRAQRITIVLIRDMGNFPCPKCLVPKSELAELGTTHDEQSRISHARHDNKELREKVEQARTLIYQKGYAVNNKRVESILADESLVPTKVCTSLPATAITSDWATECFLEACEVQPQLQCI